MTIITETFIPYEYDDKRKVLDYIASRCQQVKKSLRFIDKEEGHLTLRVPFSGDYIEVTGTSTEIDWLHTQLNVRCWYRTN